MSQEEIKVYGAENPKSLEDIARYIATKLVDNLAKEHHYVSAKASVFKDNIEILAGFYINSVEEHAEFDEEYTEALERINREDTINVRGELTTEKFNVLFMPKPCEGEHCIVGLRIVIRLNKSLNEITYWDVENIANLIKDVCLL